jgi:hypothetical protein
MSEPLTYTDPARVKEVATDTTCRPNPYVSGYGPKIPTAHRIRYPQRWYRVYVTCYGNGGSAYIESRGKRLYLDTDTQYRLKAD